MALMVLDHPLQVYLRTSWSNWLWYMSSASMLKCLKKIVFLGLHKGCWLSYNGPISITWAHLAWYYRCLVRLVFLVKVNRSVVVVWKKHNVVINIIVSTWNEKYNLYILFTQQPLNPLNNTISLILNNICEYLWVEYGIIIV